MTGYAVSIWVACTWVEVATGFANEHEAHEWAGFLTNIRYEITSY